MTSSSWQFTQFMACLYIQHVCVCVWGGACVYKYAGAVRTHSHILHYKATGKGCKSNKPVIVSPTSAPSLCFIHTHTHTAKSFPGTLITDKKRVHDLDSKYDILFSLAELQRSFPWLNPTQTRCFSKERNLGLTGGAHTVASALGFLVPASCVVVVLTREENLLQNKGFFLILRAGVGLSYNFRI